VPAAVAAEHPEHSSTQEAFGRTLTKLVDHPEVRARLVTLSPDVATSTHLAGWINRVGVFALERAEDFEGRGPRLVKWEPRPQGQHIELGISEMNLFMALSQFGRARELLGQQLVPIGTVYDPFVCRGLDALVYALYVGARMIFAGTPAGVSLSREGGAHQSTVTPSLGIELPNLASWEPCFAREVEWTLLEGIRRCCDPEGGATYLRLSTKPIDQAALDEPLRRLGEAELRRQVLAGGYRIVDRRVACPELGADVTVHLAAGGIMVPEAIAAAAILRREGVAANVVNVTSADRLFETLRTARRRQLDDAGAPSALGHLDVLFPPDERRAPIVTVEDGASHALAFLGGAYGAPVVPLGVDEFGQSGSREALYRKVGIDVDRIVAAALLALELRDG
jgi:pyruvate dehydrogenase E1 component